MSDLCVTIQQGCLRGVVNSKGQILGGLPRSLHLLASHRGRIFSFSVKAFSKMNAKLFLRNTVERYFSLFTLRCQIFGFPL